MSITELIKLAESTVITEADVDALNTRLSKFDNKVDKPIDLDMVYNL